MKFNCCYRAKVDSKAFAIPILTARLKPDVVRIGIANALESTFVL